MLKWPITNLTITTWQVNSEGKIEFFKPTTESRKLYWIFMITSETVFATVIHEYLGVLKKSWRPITLEISIAVYNVNRIEVLSNSEIFIDWYLLWLITFEFVFLDIGNKY